MPDDKNFENDQEMDFGPDYVTLTDENGEEETFELVDTMDHNGCTYVALLTTADDPEKYLNSDGSLVLLKITEEEGEEILVGIEDDDEYEMVSDLFMSRLADLYEFDEDDEE